MNKAQLKEWTSVAAMLALTGFFWFLTPSDVAAGGSIFPNVLMGLMLALALIKIVTLIFVRLPDAPAEKKEEEFDENGKVIQTEKPTKWRFWFVLAATVIYIMLVERIGFFSSSFIFFFGVTLAIQTEKRTPRCIAIRAVIVACFLVFLWVVFTKVLMAQLPKGVLM